MLEKYSDIFQCEKILSEAVENRSYIGEVPFSEEDVNKLAVLVADFIRDKMNKPEFDLSRISCVPACTAFYLVGKGFFCYTAGEFWGPVEEELGIFGSRFQKILGEKFLKFLKIKGLVQPQVEGALPYVSPILLHGGIPVSCLREFYGKIVRHFLDRGLVDKESIREELIRIRDAEEKRKDLRFKESFYSDEINKAKKEIDYLCKIFDLFDKIRDLHKEAVEKKGSDINKASIISFYLRETSALKCIINRRAKKLVSQKIDCEAKIKSLDIELQKLLGLSDEIDKLMKSSSLYWELRESIEYLREKLSTLEERVCVSFERAWNFEIEKDLKELSCSNFIQFIKILKELWQGFVAHFLGDYLCRKGFCLPAEQIDIFAIFMREAVPPDLIVKSGNYFAKNIKALLEAKAKLDLYGQEKVFLNSLLEEWTKAYEQVAAGRARSCSYQEELFIKDVRDVEINEAKYAFKVLEEEVVPAFDLLVKQKYDILDKLSVTYSLLNNLGFELSKLEQNIKLLSEKYLKFLKKASLLNEIDYKLLKQENIIKKAVQDWPSYKKCLEHMGHFKLKVQELEDKVSRALERVLGSPWQDEYTRNVLDLNVDKVAASFNNFLHLYDLYEQALKALESEKNKAVIPRIAVWSGGVLVPLGLLLVLAAKNNAGLSVLFGGILLLGIETTCFLSKRRRIKALNKMVCEADNNVKTGYKILAEELRGLPFSWEQVVALKESWIEHFKELHSNCSKKLECEQEIFVLEKKLLEYESVFSNLVNEFLGAGSGNIEELLIKLKKGLESAKTKKIIASIGEDVLEKEIIPALEKAKISRQQVSERLSLERGKQADLEHELKSIEMRLKEYEEKQDYLLKIIHDFIVKSERQKEILENNIRKQLEEIHAIKAKIFTGKKDWAWSEISHIDICSAEKILNTWLENLKVLKASYHDYCACRNDILTCEGKLRGLKGIFETMKAAFPNMPEEEMEALTWLTSKLKEAREKKREADEAKKALEDQIKPQIYKNYRLYADTCRMRRELIRHIRELGNGRLKSGLRVLKEKENVIRDLKHYKERLQNYLKDHPNITGEEEIRALLEKKNAELQLIESSLINVREKLREAASELGLAVDYTDEPVKRFIFYGGDWTVKWIVAGTALHRLCLGEVIDIGQYTSDLPPRILAELERTVKEEIEIWKNAPRIFLDVVRGDLKIAVAGFRFRLYSNETPPERITVDIYIAPALDSAPVLIKKAGLRTYLCGGFIETEPEFIELPCFAGEYTVELGIRQNIYSWKLKTWEEGPFIIFNEKGEKIEAQRLSPQKVWLFFPEEYGLFPDSTVLYEREVYVGGEKFNLALVDFAGEGPVCLSGDHGERYEIAPAADTSGSKPPYIHTGEVIGGVWTQEGQPVYSGRSLELYVPFGDVEEISSWTIKLIKKCPGGKEETTLIAEREILDLGEFRGENSFCIDLGSKKLLGSCRCGEYTVILQRRGSGDCRFELAWFPDLLILFEPEFYYPINSDAERAGFVVIIPEDLTGILEVRVKEPAVISQVDGNEVKGYIGLENDKFHADLIYRLGSRAGCTAVTVEVPVLRWRIIDKSGANWEEWKHRVEEVWHERFTGALRTQLEVELPVNLAEVINRAKIYLEKVGPEVGAKTKGRLLQADLSVLADSLRGLDGETCALCLELIDHRGKTKAKGKLFDIRTRWKAENITCTMEKFLDERVLCVAWTDLGEQNNRLLSVWRLWEPWAGALVYSVPDGDSRLEIRRPNSELPPGPYLIEFGVYDDWSGEGFSCKFPAHEYNCCRAFLDSTADASIILEECLWTGKRELRLSGRLAGGQGAGEILVGLYGVVKGRYLGTEQKAAVDKGGRFDLQIRFGPESPFVRINHPSRDFSPPHWLCIAAEVGGEPVYHCQILPGTGKMWWPINAEDDLVYILESGIDGQLYLDCVDGKLEEPLISTSTSRKILQELGQGRKEIPIQLPVGEEIKETKLCWDKAAPGAKVEFKTKAVKCTSVGCPYGNNIEPDQSTWLEKHSYCKSFLFELKEINVRLYWYVNLSAKIEAAQFRYRLAGNHLLTLFNSFFEPLPENYTEILRWPESELKSKEITRILWEREKILLSNWEDR